MMIIINGKKTTTVTFQRYMTWLNANEKQKRVFLCPELAEMWSLNSSNHALQTVMTLVRLGLAEKHPIGNSKKQHYYVPLERDNQHASSI